MQLGIVAVGYNREKTLKRLLERLNECYYEDDILLIISIDHSGEACVEKMAEEFSWQHGKKEVVTFPERLGLRQHILTCGSYMERYNLDAVAVFEDDVYPSEDFCSYMKQAVEFYRGDSRIAGISLYTHLWNVHKDMPFQPMNSSYDIFFMQFAQSWGQVWMRKQWEEFVHWYKEHSEEFSELGHVPLNVCNWPKTSWLKYHIRYCIEEDKYFVYPYASMSTCFAEVGEHVKRETTCYQVPLQMGRGITYRFPNLFQEGTVHYDAFFENMDIYRYLGKNSADICIDLYSYKTNYKGQRYWLTTKRLNFQIEESFSRSLKPHELNCIHHIAGNDIFLYDTEKQVIHDGYPNNGIEEWEFFYRKISGVRISVIHVLRVLKIKIVNRLKNYGKW